MIETLEERYKDDPELLAFYKKKLLIKGWAGQMDETEREYVRRMNPPWYAAASRNGSKGRFQKKRPRLSERKVKKVA